MGCGTSGGQVTQSYYSHSSTKPLRIEQMFLTSKATTEMNKIYLFGQTQTKRKILQFLVDQKTQLVALNKISQRYHIPRPKVQIDTLEMMYEEAQQVIPLNLYNSTTLPPFNQMFVTSLNQKLVFLCGGIDYQFWNVCAQSFLYKINSPSLQEQRTIKVKLQKPQTNMLSQKQMIQKQNSFSKRTFNKFQRLAFMNEPRYSHMGISLKHPITGKNVVYVFGGFNSNKQTLKSCEMYSFDKNLWQRIPDMTIPRATGFCFHYIDKIYVFGGFSRDQKRSKKIEVFDLTNNAWNLMKIKLHHGIEQGFISSFKPNQIIIMGGNTQGESTKSVIRFNLVEETYKWDSDLIHTDSLQKGIHYYNKVYLLGGNNPNICQVYDSKKQQWNESRIITSQQMKPGDLTLFSSLSKSLFVDFIPWSGRKKQSDQSKDDFLILGTDFYPMLQYYHSKDLLFSQKSVPMKLRLRKNMGILRLSLSEYFVCGGIDNFDINSTKATFNYNSSTGSVQELDKMPTKKYKFTLIRHKNQVYNIGGMRTNNKRNEIDLKECCRYNMLTKKWQKLPQLNFRRSQCQVVECQKGLLIFGGYSAGEWVETVEFFNTQNQKSMSFVVLSQKVPLVFPFYSKLISQNKNTLRLFILNRNIHTGNFQSIYFNINLKQRESKKGLNFPFGQDKKGKNLELSKLQQYDSIEVIINERVKTLEKQQQSGIYKKTKQFKNDFEDKANVEISKKQKLQPTLNNIKQAANKVLTLHNHIGSERIPKQQQINYPKVQIIQIKSKQNQQEDDKNKRNSEGSQIQDERNQIQEKFVDDDEKIDEMSMEFEKLSVSGLKQNENERKIESKNRNQTDLLKSPPLEEYDQSVQFIPVNKSPVLPEGKKQNIINNNNKLIRSNESNKSQPEPEHEYVQLQLSQVIKGLQQVSNLNEWIRIKQTCSETDRLLFVKGPQVIKCSLIFINENQGVKLNTTKETYQSSDILMGDTKSQQTYQTKISLLKLTHNYA